jgi:hypothetical protein
MRFLSIAGSPKERTKRKVGRAKRKSEAQQSLDGVVASEIPRLEISVEDVASDDYKEAPQLEPIIQPEVTYIEPTDEVSAITGIVEEAIPFVEPVTIYKNNEGRGARSQRPAQVEVAEEIVTPKLLFVGGEVDSKAMVRAADKLEGRAAVDTRLMKKINGSCDFRPYDAIVVFCPSSSDAAKSLRARAKESGAEVMIYQGTNPTRLINELETKGLIAKIGGKYAA